jgi:predicted outer membrane repeat protein
VAVDGDSVVVSNGVYHELINFNGKAITVMSEDGDAAGTIIDGGQSSGSVVSFVNSETSESVLQGFTIRNGIAYQGGGIFIGNDPPAIPASPTITSCIITGNQSTNSGGGIYAKYSTLSLSDTAIRNNYSGAAGGGVYLKYCNGTFIECSVENNNANNGGGIYIKESTGDISIRDSEINQNIVSSNGGGIYNKETNAIVQNCSFSLNTADKGGAWYSYSQGDAIFSTTSFSDNSAANTGGAAEIRNSSVATFTDCLFDSNVADSDCDGTGGSGAIEIVNSSVTIDTPTMCNNLVCEVEEPFSGDQPTISGEILECVLGIGACCGGSACWEMEEEVCLNGGGVWNGDTTLCATVICEGGNVDCPGDLNGDGTVEVLDIIELISAWGACP